MSVELDELLRKQEIHSSLMRGALEAAKIKKNKEEKEKRRIENEIKTMVLSNRRDEELPPGLSVQDEPANYPLDRIYEH